MKQERDVVLFRNLIRFYSFSGIFPYIQRWRKLLLLLCYLIGVIFTYKQTSHYINLWVISSLTYVITLGNLMFLALFSFLCLKNTFGNQHIWDELINEIEIFDITMKLEKNSLEENIYQYYSKFFLSNIINVFTYMFLFPYLYGITFNYQSLIGFSYETIINIQLQVIALCLENLFEILEKRYKYFKTKIKATYLNSTKNEHFWNGQQLSAAYLLLVNITQKVNVIFGTKILIILCKAVTDVIGCFSSIFLEKWQENFVQILNTFGSCAQMLFSLVSI